MTKLRVENGAAYQPVRAARGASISCKSWQQEAALRMLMNNLDPDVAERPQDLVVYGGTGRAARSWEAFDAIVATLSERLRSALRTPEAIQRFADRGLDMIASTPEELSAHLKREVQKWGRVIKERGMRAE